MFIDSICTPSLHCSVQGFPLVLYIGNEGRKQLNIYQITEEIELLPLEREAVVAWETEREYCNSLSLDIELYIEAAS